MSIICKHKKSMIGTSYCYSLKNASADSQYVSLIERRDIGNQNSNTPKKCFLWNLKQFLISCWWCVKYAFSEIIFQGNTALGNVGIVNLHNICHWTYTLFRNERFMLHEMTRWNASKFAIFYTYIWKPKVAFSVFHFVLLYFFL